MLFNEKIMKRRGNVNLLHELIHQFYCMLNINCFVPTTNCKKKKKATTFLFWNVLSVLSTFITVP